jgi:hypothetical protein
MQITIVFALAIYLGSYLPLSLILLAQDLDMEAVKRGLCSVAAMSALNCASPFKNTVWSVSAVAICLVGFLATLFVLRLLSAEIRVTVTESKHVPADLINYVIPYVVSFMSLDYEQTPKLIGFGVFLLWIFWITYKSGQIVLNPVLTVLGWKLFEIKYKYPAGSEVQVGRMLSRIDVRPGRSYRQNSLQDVMVATDGEERVEG